MDGKKKKSKKAKSPTPEEEFVVESIRDKKTIGGEVQYFIKWKDWPEATNTWEPVENLKGCTDLLIEFERQLKEKEGAGGGQSKDKKKAKKRKEPESNSESEAPKSDGNVSDLEEAPKENTIDVDVLEELPVGKIPEELLGVVPITGIMTYLVKWKPMETEGQMNGDSEDADMCLIKGDVFKLAFPLPVIEFYEKNISWLRDIRTEEDKAADLSDTVIAARRAESKSAERLKLKPASSNSKKRRFNTDPDLSSTGTDSDSSANRERYVVDSANPEADD